MRINSSSEQLATVLQALDATIKPGLTSKEAQSTIGIIQAILTDLYRRQGPQIDFLRELIAAGETLQEDILGVIKPKSNASKTLLAKSTCYEELSKRHEELSQTLFDLCESLRTTHGSSPTTPELLRRGAEWETAYYEGIQKLPVEFPKPAPMVQPPAPPLSQEYLQTVLNERKGPLEVTSFARMTGGHGKQTYRCTVRYADDKSEDLVLRKEDSAPIIMHSGFRISQEFALLQALGKTDFPSPRVFDLFEQRPGVDGAFFTMQNLDGSIPSTFLSTESQKFSQELLLSLAELQAKLHSIPLETFSDYAEKYEGKELLTQTVTERYQNTIKSWYQYYNNVEHLPSTYLSWLFDWLFRNIPQDSRRPVLTHGDFNVHNVLAAGDRITAVLDWECADFGAPEQDLAYVQPLVSQHMPWEKFLDHYHKRGGKQVKPAHFAFCQAYSVLRTTFAFNRATMNLQRRWSPDIRFSMVELGYEAVFMRMGLTYTAGMEQPDLKSEAGDQKLPNQVSAGVEALTNGQGKSAEEPDRHPPLRKFSDKATGGQQLLIFGDEGNTRQTPSTQPNWQESNVLVWWDEFNQIGGFHRLGHEPNLPGGGRVALWTHLITPDTIYKHTNYLPLRESDLTPQGGMGSGDDLCTHLFENGAHHWTFNDQGLSAKLVFTDIGPNFSGFPKKGAVRDEFASHHFDIPGLVRGTLEQNGKVYQIDGLGIRDHAWGPRDWNRSILSHRWVVGTCGESLSFVAVAYHSFDDKIATFGWVVREGLVTYAKSVDILTYMEADSAVNRGGSVKYVLDNGEELTFEHTPVRAKACVSFHHGIPCVDRICRFTCSNGLSGFSNFESSSNIQAGERRPGTLVDGIIDDGIFPAH